jgi:hypothetical protein
MTGRASGTQAAPQTTGAMAQTTVGGARFDGEASWKSYGRRSGLPPQQQVIPARRLLRAVAKHGPENENTRATRR